MKKQHASRAVFKAMLNRGQGRVVVIQSDPARINRVVGMVIAYRWRFDSQKTGGWYDRSQMTGEGALFSCSGGEQGSYLWHCMININGTQRELGVLKHGSRRSYPRATANHAANFEGYGRAALPDYKTGGA